MSFLTFVLWLSGAALMAALWNRFFARVSTVDVLLMIALISLYQAPTLFSTRVDVPANLAFVAQPWASTGRPAVKANTGIVFTELVPWTQAARESLRDGEWPLWNRNLASGAPLLANQQTAIFHPFTLAGLVLPIGKAWTLSVSLRLFAVLFFTFAFLRRWCARGAAWFGAIAYTFCTFHVVWLLFPLGLATMMLPLVLCGVAEVVERPSRRALVLLAIGLSAASLGGHPESAAFVWIVGAGYVAIALVKRPRRVVQPLLVVGAGFILAILLTAFFWYPTLEALPLTPRWMSMQSRDANPADHGLSSEWLMVLAAPNILGTPMSGTYQPPRGRHAAVLDDYGEVVSGYAGAAVLALALASLGVARRAPRGFAICCAVVALATFAEAPFWRDVVHAIPLIGISLHQRLRIVWVLGLVIAAAVTLHAYCAGELTARRLRIAIAVVAAAIVFVWLVRDGRLATGSFAFVALNAGVSMTALAALFAATFIARADAVAVTAAIATFAELVVLTRGYNPPSSARDLYPVTGAIAAMQSGARPYRIAALGWSFLPDTPGFYELEDIKTTDPIQHTRYMRLMRGYLHVRPDSYDQLIGGIEQPFLDYLNVRYLYAPPETAVDDARFSLRYRGPDGAVYENRDVMPRYTLVRSAVVEPEFEMALVRSKEIHDFRERAVVDHVPDKIRRVIPDLSTLALAGGRIHEARYGRNETQLQVDSNGWNLLVSSDVAWPGWRAYWNGARLPPVTVNGAFLGTFVPPGRGTLTFRYRPAGFERALRVSFGAMIVLLTVAFWRGRSDRGEPGSP